MHFSFSSAIGFIRQNQEDAHGGADGEFFVVADGLGGCPAGEVASSLAVETAIATYKIGEKRSADPTDILKLVFIKANEVIFEKAKSDPENYGMATTMVAAVVKRNNFWIGNIGDSRAYLFKNGKTAIITRDHEDRWGVLTRAVGVDTYGLPDIFRGKLDKLAKLLLVTDGLTDIVEKNIIDKVLQEEKDVQAVATRLVKMALDLGGPDNVTVCVISKY